MASNMKAVKLRIKSVENTRQITKAMELVASSKLRKAKDRAEASRPYYRELHRTLHEIAVSNTDFTSVYAKGIPGNRECVVVIAGDRGLAGGYNSNLFKKLEAEFEGREFVAVPVGKKAVEYMKRNKIPILTEMFGEIATVSVADCFEMARLLCQEFRNGSFDHIEVFYTTFVSMLDQHAGALRLLPLQDLKTGETEAWDVSEEREDHDVIWYEPEASEVFDAIVPEYLAGVLHGCICDSLASELAARRMAMDAATKNADEMIEQLNLYYNRARQASITQEITEIVAGADGV